MAELFHTYRVNQASRWWQRLAFTAAGSCALHLVFVGCVLYVPAMRDGFRIANLFSDAEYADEDYELRTIKDRSVTWINPNGRFGYPSGYFSANKQVSSAQIISEARPRPTPVKSAKVSRPRMQPGPQPTPRPTPTPTLTPPLTPLPPALLPTPSVVPTPVVAAAAATPTPTSVNSGDKSSEAAIAAAAAAAAAASTPQNAEETLNKQAAEADIKRPKAINKRPFVDLLAKANRMRVNGELDLSGTISMTVEADRNPDGTLSNMETDGVTASNQKLVALANEFVQALSASRALSFLEGVGHLRMVLNLNQKSIAVRVVTDLETIERAEQMTRGYNGLLIAGRIMRRGKDEAVVWNSTKISSTGRQVTVSFEMSRDAAAAMLAKQIPQSTP